MAFLRIARAFGTSADGRRETATRVANWWAQTYRVLVGALRICGPSIPCLVNGGSPEHLTTWASTNCDAALDPRDAIMHIELLSLHAHGLAHVGLPFKALAADLPLQRPSLVASAAHTLMTKLVVIAPWVTGMVHDLRGSKGGGVPRKGV